MDTLDYTVFDYLKDTNIHNSFVCDINDLIIKDPCTDLMLKVQAIEHSTTYDHPIPEHTVSTLSTTYNVELNCKMTKLANAEYHRTSYLRSFLRESCMDKYDDITYHKALLGHLYMKKKIIPSCLNEGIIDIHKMNTYSLQILQDTNLAVRISKDMLGPPLSHNPFSFYYLPLPLKIQIADYVIYNYIHYNPYAKTVFSYHLDTDSFHMATREVPINLRKIYPPYPSTFEDVTTSPQHPFFTYLRVHPLIELPTYQAEHDEKAEIFAKYETGEWSELSEELGDSYFEEDELLTEEEDFEWDEDTVITTLEEQIEQTHL